MAGCIVVALEDFKAEAEQELSVSEGERLKVLSVENGWCTAETLDRGAPPGLVPLSYLKFAENQSDTSFSGLAS